MGKTLSLASNYLISLSIRVFFSMPRIYQYVEVKDNVIKKLLSISVKFPWSTIKDDVAGEIVKADGQKVDDADSPVAL